MRIADIKYNDTTNGEGVCVSLWVQGCQIRCPGCHNASLWDPQGGQPRPVDLADQIKTALTANGIQRNFSVLGGEPLAHWNLEALDPLIQEIRYSFPDIKIFVWTGYTIEGLRGLNDAHINNILNNINVLIDGPFKIEERDITLKLRGSKNQRILYKGKDF